MNDGEAARDRRRALAWLLSLVVACALAFVAFKLVRRWRKPPALCITCGDCPELFRLNPARKDIGPQGLRDRGYPIPKPPGTRRILILGDSVVYGTGVEREQTFAKRLETRLGNVEVINSGVPGYSPYNELQYYRSRGRAFQPDLVLLTVCFNDVVNPGPHWNGTEHVVDHIPIEAIPNPGRKDRGLGRPPPTIAHGEDRYPSFLGSETDLTIEVLTNRQSPEWKWLERIYGQLIEAVHADGAQLAIVITPLRYQVRLDDYPLDPAAQFLDYCRSQNLSCLDLLPALRRARPDMLDPFHLDPHGHEVVAQELERFLREHPSLLPR